MAIIEYGHHDHQDDVCSGCRVRTRTRRLGSSLAGFEVRGVAAGHPERGKSATCQRGGCVGGTRPASGVVAFPQRRRETVGAGRRIRATGSRSAAWLRAAMIHLDTSFLVRALIPGTPEEVKLRRWVEEGEALIMSSVAWTEFLCGPLDAGDVELAERFVERRRDFTPGQAVVAARLFNDSGRRRGTIIDCMIGAAALADGAPIATPNVADFSRFAAAGLKMA